MKLYPLHECFKTANEKLAAGATAVHQQFLCGKCGVKQTIDTPNAFFTYGSCEECKFVTDLMRTGCNYMIMYSNVDLPIK
jgi:hypothetical protein